MRPHSELIGQKGKASFRLPICTACGFLVVKREVTMNNPKLVAAISGVVALYLAYSIFGPADEAPGTALNIMNWVFFLLAAVACVGSIIQILKKERE